MAQKKRHPCCVSKDEFVSRQTGEEGLLIPGVQKQVLNAGERCPFAVEKDHRGGIVEIHSMRRLLQRVERRGPKAEMETGWFSQRKSVWGVEAIKEARRAPWAPTIPETARR